MTKRADIMREPRSARRMAGRLLPPSVRLLLLQPVSGVEPDPRTCAERPADAVPRGRGVGVRCTFARVRRGL